MGKGCERGGNRRIRVTNAREKKAAQEGRKGTAYFDRKREKELGTF